MDRTNGTDWADIGGGNRGFKDENVVAGTAGTEVTADHLNATQEEMLNIIEQAGLVPDANDWTQLYQAVIAIGAVNLLKNNLVFPEIETASAKLAITDNADGTLTIDASQSWLWRGMMRFGSDNILLADRTVTTAASKTYHLVWHAPGTGTAVPEATYPNGRFELADLTGANPAETDVTYDSTYDRMLIARIVTDGANAATLTGLANKARIFLIADVAIVNIVNAGVNAAAGDLILDYNWGRRPGTSSLTLVYRNYNAPSSGGFIDNDITFSGKTIPQSRYGINFNILEDLAHNAGDPSVYHVSLGA